MNRITLTYLTVMFILVSGKSPDYKMQLVPNEVTAIKIAEAVWLPIYGLNIYDKMPFIANLQGDTVWHVKGTLKPSGWSVDKQGDSVLTITTGGVPHIRLRKDNGCIIDVYHSR